MGEVAECMMDGTLCQSCGSLNDDFIAAGEKQAPNGGDVHWEPPGHPITCSACRRENAQARRLAERSKREGR